MPTLNWIGKEAVVNHHHQVPYRLLTCVPELSAGDPDAGNLLVEGDNLEALKALLPYYGGQVKCIYIDPPYNTGNEGWVYNDNVNSPEIRAWLHKTVGKEAEDLTRHDKWLCMMYPRLALLREFLRQDGAIFVSIDDTEGHYLRALMDEIFGPRNFIATIVWQKKQSPQNDAINLSDMHDYLVVYAKCAKQNRDDPNGWRRNLLPRTEVSANRYTNRDNDPRGPWTSSDCTCNKTRTERPNLYYGITNPNTGESVFPSERRVWVFEKEVFESLIRENRIWWGTSANAKPRLKNFLCDAVEGMVPSTWWPRDFAGDNQEGKRECRAIFAAGETDFPTPKPTRLIRRILQIATDADSLVMDSFAGSASTGHAVLQANVADGGRRRFLLVEMDPQVCRAVACERLKRVIASLKDAETPVMGVHQLRSGFRYCRLGTPLFDEGGNIAALVSFADLAAHVFFTETGVPIPKRATGKSPLLGVHEGKAVYLLFNGVMGDRRLKGGNVLTGAVLAKLPPHDGPKIVYGEACRLSPERLSREGVVFRQIPYEIKVT